MTPKPRTYWHLRGLERRPSDYDIVTSRLLYHPQRGYAVSTPVARWLETHRGGTLHSDDWDTFADPDELTYRDYVAARKQRDLFVQRLFHRIEIDRRDERWSSSWLAVLERVFAPLRYPVHGLQMVSAYIGSVAPSGRLVVTSMMQAADELRRVQTLAYRLRLMQRVHPELGVGSRQTWEADPAWQPWRRLVEELLVTYAWDEALVALCGVVKPAFDALFLGELGRLAVGAGDASLSEIFHSLDDDCVWQRKWWSALQRWLVGEDPANARRLASLGENWRERTRVALEPLVALLESDDGASGLPPGEASAAIARACEAAAVPPDLLDREGIRR